MGNLTPDPPPPAPAHEPRARFQVLARYCGIPNPPPRPENAIRLVCISDTHGRMDRTRMETAIPFGDVLIHAGDFSMMGARQEVAEFHEFLCALPHAYKICIAGNHELSFDDQFLKDGGDVSMMKRAFVRDAGDRKWSFREGKDIQSILKDSRHVHYLQDSGLEIAGGLYVYGSPWQPEFHNWAFNLPRHSPALVDKWKAIPDRTDILITHGPPYMKGDRVVDGTHVGCEDLLARVKQVRPLVHVFGHIHEAYSVSEEFGTTFANASTCTVRYRAVNPAIVIDLTRSIA